jgi:hypothetical protein
VSYEEALEAAGAVVHCAQYFGSYQGEAWARVTYKGQTGWVSWSYGSCGYCDHYESRFGFSPSQEDLAEFGREYLEDIMTYERALKESGRHLEWDETAEEMVKFIKEGE